MRNENKIQSKNCFCIENMHIFKNTTMNSKKLMIDTLLMKLTNSKKIDQ